jgi:hypothetical protein
VMQGLLHKGLRYGCVCCGFLIKQISAYSKKIRNVLLLTFKIAFADNGRAWSGRLAANRFWGIPGKCRLLASSG